MRVKELNERHPSEAIVFYYELGFNVIPLKGKEAIIKNWSKYTKERIPEDVISKFKERILKENLNIGIITKFNGLLVYDCDSEDLYLFFKEKFKEIFGDYPENKTFVCKTGKGYHVYLKVLEYKNLKGEKVIYSKEEGDKKIEIRRKFGGYVVVPPSIHPELNVKYQWIHSDNVESILEVKEEDIIKLESLINPNLWESSKLKQTVIETQERDLTDKEIEELIKFIEPYWKEGQRQLILLSLSYILRVFGKIRYDSVVKLYEKIKETLGDDPKDYSQRIAGIRLTFEKEIDEVGYKPWLEQLGWEVNEIEEFKLGILKIINKNVGTLFRRGFSWIYRVKMYDWKEDEDDNGNLIYKQKVIINLLSIKNGKVIDEERSYLRIYDGETKNLLEEKFTKYMKKELLTTKQIDYIKGYLTQKGTYVKLAIVENNKKHIVEGLLDDVLEILHKRFRILGQGGKEKLGQLLSFLAKFEDKFYSYPGVVIEDNKFIAVIPGTEEGDYLFPETENQARWLNTLKEASKNEFLREIFIDYLNAWLKYKEFLPRDVYYISLGYTFIAPLLNSLVNITGLKPGLYLIGVQKSGKTTLGKFIAVVGYGSPSFSKETLKTGFRFDEVLSIATIPILFDDLEKAPEQTISGLKAVLTGEITSFRGQGNLKIKDYKLIATPIIPANRDVLNLSSDPALLDRLIILRLDQRLTKDHILSFRKEIQRIIDKNITVAPYLIKAIVDVANSLGGPRYFKERFDFIYSNLMNEIETENRNIEKAIIILLGLEIADRVFKQYLGKGIDLKEGEKVVKEFFKKPLEIYEVAPEELVNLATILKEMPPDIEIEIREENGKKCFVITQEVLTKLRQKYNRIPLPNKLSDLRNMVLSLFRELDPKEIYKVVRLQTKDNKPYKAVLIYEEIVNKLLGIGEEKEETENESNVQKTLEKQSNEQNNEDTNVVKSVLGEIREASNEELDF